MAIAGFNNCCKTPAGDRALVWHTVTVKKRRWESQRKTAHRLCRHILLEEGVGVCLQKKKAYCQFDSKLAQLFRLRGAKGSWVSVLAAESI